MVSIRKRVSKKNTRRQRREKKQRGGQNNQQNRIERLAQNELQNKSQRGGGALDLSKIVKLEGDELKLEKGKEALYNELEVWASGNIYFIKKDNDVSASYHAGTGETLNNKSDLIKAYLTESANKESEKLKNWGKKTGSAEFTDGDNPEPAK